MKLGPDAAAWVDSPSDYALIPSDAHLDTFYNTVKEYLPSIDRSKLTLDYAGIRPKLAGPGEPFRYVPVVPLSYICRSCNLSVFVL
jgi:hypothetical protein